MKKYFYLILAICMIAIPNRKNDDSVNFDEEMMFI